MPLAGVQCLVPDFPLTASVRFSARIRRAGHFLLLVQEKVTKENTPRMPRSRDGAARVRENRPGFVERTSLCVQRTRAHRARDLFRHFRPALAAANGDPKIKSKSAPFSRFATASPAAQGKRKLLLFAFRSCRSLLLLLPLHAPSIAGGGGGKARMSERRDARVRADPPVPRSAGHLARTAREVRCRGASLTPGILPFAASRPASPFAPLLRRSAYFSSLLKKSKPLAAGEWKLLPLIIANKSQSGWMPALLAPSRRSPFGPFAARRFARTPARAVAGTTSKSKAR